MSFKRTNSSCRPESANTQTTRLTLPSETIHHSTTGSGFRLTEQRNQFGDSMLQEDMPVKKQGVLNKASKRLSKEEQHKEKQKEKMDYDRQKSKPLQKSAVVREDGNKPKKQTKSIVSDSRNPAAPLKLARGKEDAPKPPSNIVLPKESEAKIDYSKWKRNDKQSGSKQTPKQQQPKQSAEEQSSRQRNQLSRFINEMELKNMELLSNNYEMSIESATRKIKSGEMEDLDIWKSSLENQFSDTKFYKLIDSIEKNQKELNEEAGEEEKQELASQSNVMSEQSLMNMTLSDLQQRNNLFLTEINREKKLKTESISTLEEIEKSQQKMHMLDMDEGQSEHQSSDSEDESPLPAKPSKNPLNNPIQRNIISISSQYYQCDYLPEVYKHRLSQLLEEIETGANHTPNPFELSEQLSFHIKLIDEGIRVYRGRKMEQLVIEAKDLPGDAELRKEAELKILKSKLEQVNAKLLSLNKRAVTKEEIGELIKELRQNCLVPQSKVVETKKQKMKEMAEKSQETRRFIESAAQNSKEMEADMEEIKQKFQELEEDIVRLNNLTAEEQRQLQVASLQEFRAQVDSLSKNVEDLPQLALDLEAHATNIRESILKIQQQYSVPQIPAIQVPGYRQDEDIQAINRVIEHKIRTNVLESPSSE